MKRLISIFVLAAAVFAAWALRHPTRLSVYAITPTQQVSPISVSQIAPAPVFAGERESWYIALDWLWGILVGALITGLIGFVARRREIKRIKEAIRDELHANQFQIVQKRDIVQKMIKALKQQEYLPGKSIPPFTTVFANNYPSVVNEYKSIERDNLHVIYAYLRFNDEFLAEFEQKFKEERRDGVIADVWAANISQLEDIDKSYEIVSMLIAGFLEGKPRDPLYRHSATGPPMVFVSKKSKTDANQTTGHGK